MIRSAHPAKRCSQTIPWLWVLITALILASHHPLFSQQSSKLILKDEKPFSGKLEFKFALISRGVTLWSNDQSSREGEEPKKSVSLEIKEGVFDIRLGREGMAPIYSDVVKLFPGKMLYIWIDRGSGFELFNILPVTDDQLEFADESHTGAPLAAPKWERQKKEIKGVDDVHEYFQYRMIQKGLDKEPVRMNALLRAKARIDSMPVPRDAGIWVWEWLGPSNIGGRIRAIIIRQDHPDTMLIGSVSGGIWRTYDAGGTWTPMDDFMPALTVTSMVIDPNNNNIMYASTGEIFAYWGDGLPGAGIFKSTDGGTTWIQLPSTNNNNFKWIGRIAIHPDSSQVLWAAAWNGIYKSVDGGNNWTPKSLLTWPEFGMDVKIHPNLPQYIMFGTNNKAYLSSNYGNTFSSLSTGSPGKLPASCGRCETAFCPSENGKIYITMRRNRGEIWCSGDFGATWILKYSNYPYMGPQGDYNNSIWVDPYNSNCIIIGGIELWRSCDGGSTIQPISNSHFYHVPCPNYPDFDYSAHADQHVITQRPDYDPIQNPRIYVGNDGGIQTTGDVWGMLNSCASLNWTNLAGSSLGITQFYGGAAYPDGSLIVGGTQDNDQVRYRSSGSYSGTGNWYQAETGDGGFSAINPEDPNTVYSEYAYLQMEKSTNNGDTYENHINGLADAETNRALFIAPFVMDPNNSARLVAGGKTIWRTDNEAENWFGIRDSIGPDYPWCSAIDIAKGNSNIMWVGYTNGQVAKSVNGTSAGPTWTVVDINGANPLPDRYVTDIAIDPLNPNEVWVTFNGPNSDNVWMTTDGGATWQPRNGTAPNDLPALQVNTIRVHPVNDNWIYIGTDLGVFASGDKGATWSVMPRYPGVGHEGPVNTEVSELFWQGEFLIAATHGRGMFRAAPLATIYVDLNAAPGGNGTLAAPYKTVTEAVANQGPGSTISIKSGTYNEAGTVLFSKKCVVVITNSPGGVVIK
jgi:photosystem II stability/assembly factor-like uncharacterized protein